MLTGRGHVRLSEKEWSSTALGECLFLCDKSQYEYLDDLCHYCLRIYLNVAISNMCIVSNKLFCYWNSSHMYLE